MTEFKWYILKTKSNCEAKARTSVENLIQRQGFSDCVKEILIPERDVVEVVKGKKVTRSKKIYPGYIFVNMQFSEKLWHAIKGATHVIHFVGGVKSQPLEVPADQLDVVNRKIEDSVRNPQAQVTFSEGENVQVIGGPFKNFSGVVEEVNQEKGRVKVYVNIFGRPTPVEFDFSQVHRED